MAITIDKIEALNEYFNGVMNRADHHADSVNEVVLALIGGVVWRAEGDFEVKEYAGAPANILWMTVSDKRYCFKFNHQTGKIECLAGGHNGDVITTFDNDTNISEVKNFFAKL